MKWAQFGIAMTILTAGHAAMAGDPAVITDEAGRMNRVDQFVRAEMQREKVPGVVLGIVSKGEVIAVKGYGYANVELGVPVTDETIFQSGSVGKQFTAAAVMLQVEDGKLALDDSITKYFTDAPESWRPITVRNLLTHTSGIPDYEANIANASYGTGALDYRRDYTEEELTKIAYGMPLEFVPGSRWNYSNTGYVLLGLIVQRVSGQSLARFSKERIFAPLGMHHTQIHEHYDDLLPGRAYSYGKGPDDRYRYIALSNSYVGATDVFTTVDDLTRWDRNLDDGHVGGKALVEQMQVPTRLNGDREKLLCVRSHCKSLQRSEDGRARRR